MNRYDIAGRLWAWCVNWWTTDTEDHTTGRLTRWQ